MKNARIVCAAMVVLVGMIASVSAGERATISKSTLGSMGLGSMQLMSDHDGSAVRGKGTSASVWGTTNSNVFGNSASTGYSASASHHHSPSLAAGASIAVSGVGGSIGGLSGFIVGGSVGGSIAYAK